MLLFCWWILKVIMQRLRQVPSPLKNQLLYYYFISSYSYEALKGFICIWWLLLKWKIKVFKVVLGVFLLPSRNFFKHFSFEGRLPRLIHDYAAHLTLNICRCQRIIIIFAASRHTRLTHAAHECAATWWLVQYRQIYR